MNFRIKETDELNRLYERKLPQFIALCSRRGMGKTHLVNEVFKDRFCFVYTGIPGMDKKNQLKNFYNELQKYGIKKSSCPKNWLDAFFLLKRLVRQKDDGRKQVIFIDEIQFLDNPRSDFISGLESFWNGFGDARKNMFLIVAGSDIHWMKKKIIHNCGGLYGRVTSTIWLKPFSLRECEDYFINRNFSFTRFEILQIYMIMGGVPDYLRLFKRDKSLKENIEEIFFGKNSFMKEEFVRLLNMFSADRDSVLELLKPVCDLKTDELKDSDTLKVLADNEYIREYKQFKGNKPKFYRINDLFINFYIKFVLDNDRLEDDFWASNTLSSNINSFRTLAFENICFANIYQIKKELGINGVISREYACVDKDNDCTDLIIERNDNIYNMCEIRFYGEAYPVNDDYDNVLRDKSYSLSKKLKPYTGIRKTLVSPFGVRYIHYRWFYDDVIEMDALFSE